MRQVFRQLGFEQCGANPFEALFVVAHVLLVHRLGAGHIAGHAVFIGYGVKQAVQQVFGIPFQAFGVFVYPFDVEQTSVQHAQG